MSDVGFIGLGTIEAAMTRRLTAAGHSVAVWNRSRGAVDELVADGAMAAGRPEGALATSIVFLMLASDRATSTVFTDEMLRSKPGVVHVTVATVSLENARTCELDGAGACLVEAAPRRQNEWSAGST